MLCMSAQRFRTTLWLHGRTATGLTVPADVVAALDGGRRPPVRVTLHAPSAPGGSYTYRSTVASMGGEYLLPVAAEHRTAAGLAAGDELEVELERDHEPRTVEVPEDLAAALEDDADGRAFFDGLSYSHQRAYTEWIQDAKRPETRARRVSRAAEMLHEGRKR